MARVKLQYNITVRVKTEICVWVKIKVSVRVAEDWFTRDDQGLLKCRAVRDVWIWTLVPQTYCLLMF